MEVSKNDSPSNPTMSISAEWEEGTENTPVYAVVSAVADAEEVDPAQLPPLYNTVDPEALNDLFASRSESSVAMVELQYAGYTIVVHGSGEVEIRTVQ